MLSKFNELTIYEDIWKEVQYDYKSWQDFDIGIVWDIVYRFPKKNINLESLLVEQRVLDIVNKNVSINVPKLDIIKWIWFKYQAIKWEDMGKTNISELSSTNKEILIDSLVKILKELHSIPISKFYFLDKDTPEIRELFFKSFITKIKKKLKFEIHSKYIERLCKYLEDFSKLKFQELSFVHTDIKKANIIINKTNFKVNWLIDFSNSRITWAEEDFVFFLEFWEEIFSEILRRYLWKSNTSFSEMVKFIAKKTLIFDILNDDFCLKKNPSLKYKIENFNY